MEYYTLRVSEEIPDIFWTESALESLSFPILHTQTLQGKSRRIPDGLHMDSTFHTITPDSREFVQRLHTRSLLGKSGWTPTGITS
jgi:hypothetical protein